MSPSTTDSTPLEQPARVVASPRSVIIGFPASNHPGERRFPLTPEGAALLIDRGFRVKVEKGAARPIHYTDSQYLRSGAEICSRDEALACDIVIHLAPVSPRDARIVRRGAILFTLLSPHLQNPQAIELLRTRHVIAIALDLIEDSDGNRPFDDILAEIDGRAAMALASSLLADAEHGKGILLGGIAGIVPCEVSILGSGIAACSAARSAVGMGAMVRMFDDDVYSLRRAARELGHGLITSSFHPKVINSALRSADIVVATPVTARFSAGSAEMAQLKKGVLIFDLSGSGPSSVFPSLRPIDLATAASHPDISLTEGNRVCYTHVGSAVPRTAAMALSNTLLTMLDSIMVCDGATNALKLLPGLRKGAYTFAGRIVNATIADIAGLRAADISLFLSFS